jgi:sarcosine oxidase subunit beta
MKTIESEVVVIGGGIVGCASAYYLAQRHVSVVLLERSVIGGEGSGRNGGGVRQQCRDLRELPLAIASVKLWECLEDELGFDIEYRQGGNIRLAATDDRMEELTTLNEQELTAGLEVELWDRTRLRECAPYLADLFVGAKYCATDGVANPILATKALGWAAERAGARLMVHTEASEIRLRSGRVSSVLTRGVNGEVEIGASTVINAAGPWAAPISRTVSVDLPLRPVRAILVTTEPLPPLFTEFISSHDVGIYTRPTHDGSIHVGTVGVREYTFEKSIPIWALRHLARIGQMIPALENVNFVRAWAGSLAMAPDGVPILGPADGIDGYILATGFSGHGFCLGPIVGLLLSELVVDGKPSLSLDEFRLSRFDVS